MATWYFDTNAADNSLDGHSPATALKDYDAFRAGGGGANSDTYLFKRGTTHVISTANLGFRSGLSSTNRTIIGAYGTASVPYATITPPPTGTLNNDFIANCSGLSNIDFYDIYFDALSRTSYTLYILASGSTANSNHKFARCYFTGAKAGSTSGSGLTIGGTATSTGDTGNYLFEDCHFFNNPVHGFLPNGVHDVIMRRCKFYGNGFNAPNGGHGFSSKYRLQEFTSSGWTNSSGTIWYYVLQAYQVDVYYVKTSVSGYGRLVKNTSTPTAPGLGEFGVSGGNLYINVGSATNPASQSVQYAWGRCYNLLVEDCEAWGNVNDPASPFVEGHGFAFDNWTDNSIFRRNKSYNNGGAGFTCNLGDNNLIEACIAYGNQASGIAASSAGYITARHNTFYDNNLGAVGIRNNGEITFFQNCRNGDISNNVLRHIGDVQYGIDLHPTAVGFTGSNNCIYGYSAAERGSVFTGTLLVNPLLDSENRATAATVKRGGVYFGGRDFFGKYHTNPPSIGAVSDHPDPAWAAAGRKAA